MRVAYDVGPLLDPPTGVGRYAGELSTALEARGVDLVRFAVALRGGGGRGRRVPAMARWRIPARVARGAWRRFDRPAITRLTGPVDLVHATNFVLPSLGDAPGVVTIHDLSFFRDDVFPGGEALRDLVPWSAERAARVIVPSNAIGDEVAERFGIAPERVTVTHEGVADVFFGATPLAEAVLGRLGIPGPFVLAAGTLEPRKNLRRLLRAWSSVRARSSGWSLVLAGPKGWGPELPETEGVILTGWVDDATLPGLMAAADIFCYPSLYEGFGLPPLEAMAAGTPTVVGDYRAAREVVDDAAVLVHPEDEEALADALLSLAEDPARRAALQVAGRARATGFTWDKAAQATLEAYSSVIGGEVEY